MKKPTFLFSMLLMGLIAAAPSGRSQFRGDIPLHVRLAEQLVTHCSAHNTAYQHSNGVVSWKTDTSDYQSFADCSGFLNALFRQSYHYTKADFKSWMGAPRPYAYHYYDAIMAQNRFQAVRQIGEVTPGDIIAIKYIDRSEHDDNTGHCMLVDGVPRLVEDVPIRLSNTRQYEVRVIDSSKSPHGKLDSRRVSDGQYYDGLGTGLFRLYTDSQDRIVGYSWSLQLPKADFDPLENPVAVGHLTSF